MACLTEIKRWLFFIFNFIFFCLGVVVLVVGVMSRLKTDNWTDLISVQTLFEVGNLFIAAGVIVTMIALLGLLGALKRWKWMLVVYAFCVILIFALEVYAGGDAFLNKEKVKIQLSEGLKNAVAKNFGLSDPASVVLTEAVNWMQEQLKCCGAEGYGDWETSHWRKSIGRRGGEIVPKTCCRAQTQDCNKNATNIYQEGCSNAGNKFSTNHLWTLGTVALVIAFVQLTGVFLATNLICAFRADAKKPKTSV